MPEWVAIAITIVLSVVVLWVFTSAIAWLFSGDLVEGMSVGAMATAVIAGIAGLIWLISIVLTAVWGAVGG